MMVEVTQEDRETAASGYYAWCSGNPVIPNRILGGDADDHSMVQAFARHRIAAEQRGKLEGARLALEAAAKVADEHARLAWGIGEREGQSPICSSGRNYGARAVEQAIRALDPAKIVGEG